MKAKLGAVLVCLVFAVPFGGVGAGASWVVYRMFADSHRAQDWVGVRANVDAFSHGKVEYHYTFRGVEHRGDRLGPNPIGGTDDIDSWHDDMYAMFSEAKTSGKPITVWVNPDDPGESMVDRNLRWKLVLFALPFALGFGGVGLGALYFAVRTIFSSPREIEAQPDPVARVQAGKGSGVLAMWVFAFFWNVISFPIAFIAIPPAIANGEWMVLLVGLFPLVGLLLLWGAIGATVKAIRDRFAARDELQLPPLPATRPADGFARGMIDTSDDGLPAAPDPTTSELEKLSGKKLTDEQRAQLAAMDPKVRAMVTKFAGWVGKIKQEH